MQDCSYVKAFENEADFLEWLIALRRWVHQRAELSFKEKETSTFIQERLQELGVVDVEVKGGTGIIAKIPGNGKSSACVALRADMDALPLQEETGLPYKSQNRGVMHACGHDGHVAMLLGAIALLTGQEPLDHDVICIFQPAEESGKGAKKLVSENVLEGVDAIFAGHIDTHFDLGVVTVDKGIICAYADPFLIHIIGHGGHAARPHEAADAVVAAASLVTIMQTLVSREVDPNNSAVVTVGSFQAGKVHNVIADEAVLEGTIRSTDTVTREKTIKGLGRIVHSVGDMYNVKSSLHFTEGLPAVINTSPTVEIARDTANDITDEALVISQGKSSLGGEDFACYQELVSGCMVRFGARKEGAGVAHCNTFDFDEGVLLVGAKWLAGTAKRWKKT